jgi:hypothetical protein
VLSPINVGTNSAPFREAATALSSAITAFLKDSSDKDGLRRAVDAFAALDAKAADSRLMQRSVRVLQQHLASFKESILGEYDSALEQMAAKDAARRAGILARMVAGQGNGPKKGARMQARHAAQAERIMASLANGSQYQLQPQRVGETCDRRSVASCARGSIGGPMRFIEPKVTVLHDPKRKVKRRRA